MKTETKVILLAVFIAAVSWIADAVFDFYALAGKISIWQSLIGAISIELYIRVFIVLMFIGLGFFAAGTIRKLMRAEEELKVRTALLRQFVEHTPAAVAMFDKQMHYLLYSKRFLLDYGLGDRDITGLWHYNVFPDIPEHWKEAHQRTLNGEVVECEEDKFVRADGSVVWIRWELQPWINRAGEIGGIIIFSEVITERKKAELALKESEEKYRNLIETTDTGYIIVDVEGKVVDANTEYVRMSGHDNIEEILGKSVLDWTAPYDVERSISELRTCIEQGYIRDLEIDYIAPGGYITPVEVNATALETHGEKRILALCRNISERKLAEEERQAFEMQVEEHKRRFYRETIKSVTDGKLDISDSEEIGAYLASASLVMDVENASMISDARHAVEGFCRKTGLAEDQVDFLILGVGEAITNAIKHAVSARVYAGKSEDSIWIAVSDKGKGIDSLILPQAVLLRGFSTKPSLGLGYCVMLDVADHILLNTGIQGTTVVLVKSLQGPEPDVSLDLIPDTWQS